MPSTMLLIALSCTLLSALLTLTWVGYRLREAGYDLFDAHMALYFDPEAALDNRRRMSRRLHRHRGDVTAVAIVSLHGLADIRAAYGHRIATAVLGHLSRRRHDVRLCNANPYRLSTDEIVLVWTGPASTRELWHLCQVLMQPVQLNVAGRDTAVTVAVSAGFYAVGAADEERTILSRADAALQCALAKGPGHVVVWSDDLPVQGRVRQQPPVCALIEFDPALPTEVVTGPSADLVARHVVRVLAVRAAAQLGRLTADAEGVGARIVLPDPDDPAADILGWLDELQASATCPRVTFVDGRHLHHAGHHPGPVQLAPGRH